MFTVNKTKGIGEVIEVLENSFIVYFSEVDEEKELLKAFTKTFNTYEEAEQSLNPEISNEKVNSILSEIEDNKASSIEAKKTANWLESHNA